MPAISWAPSPPVWVEQWPFPLEKLQALKEIVKEQLAQGHIKPSFSPWNTPLCVIRKASKKWRMLQDLRKVNKRMKLIGTPLRGMPWIPAIPSDLCLTVIDLKDCFFSITLQEPDCEKFAFSVPSPKYQGPDKRYEWTVLPQGMSNSPGFCRVFLKNLLQSILIGDKALMYVYMDDIMIGAPNSHDLQKLLNDFIQQPEYKKFVESKEKVQLVSPLKI